jgi:hypothetical protein
VGEERVEEVAEGSVGGLATGREEQAYVTVHLVIRESASLDRGADQLGDDVIPGLPTPGLHHRCEKAGELLRRLRGRAGVVSELQERQRPAVEGFFPLAWQSQKPRDHQVGEPGGEVCHQIEHVALDESIDQLVGERRETLALVARNRARAEGRGCQLAIDPMLLGVLHRDEALPDCAFERDLVHAVRWEPLHVLEGLEERPMPGDHEGREPEKPRRLYGAPLTIAAQDVVKLAPGQLVQREIDRLETRTRGHRGQPRLIASAS